MCAAVKRQPSGNEHPAGYVTIVLPEGPSASDDGVIRRWLHIAINVDRPETDDSVSAIWVPIKYSDDVLGVLSVQSPRADHFDADDVKLLEAVARYLAIAVRNQRSLRVAAHPWAGTLQPIVALGLLALLATAVLTGF